MIKCVSIVECGRFGQGEEGKDCDLQSSHDMGVLIVCRRVNTVKRGTIVTCCHR